MIVGVDIGGTKTHLAADDGSGRRREHIVPTEDWRGREDGGADAGTLAALVLALTDGAAPAALVVGAHGCDNDEDCADLQQRLAAHLSGAILVLNDSELLLPAAGKASGIAVIAGTGSIAVGRRADRRMIAAGGWGWYLGDEGSASGLVRDAARAVRASLDSGAPMDELGRALMAALGIRAPVDLGRMLSGRGSAAEIGSLAPLVFAAAEAGSQLAVRVIVEGGRALALLAERLLARGAAAGDVVTGGGVIARQPRLFDAFRAALAESGTPLRLTLLREPPVEGALLLAGKLATGERPPMLPLPHVGSRAEAENDGAAA